MRIRLIVLLMLLTSFIFAQNMWDEALPIRQGVNIEWSRATAVADDGGIVYVWSDTKLGGRDLYAMKYDENGNSLWGEEPTTIDDKIDRQEDPVIIKTSDGGFVIAWVDFSLDQDGDVFAQKISNEGELLWQTGGVPVCTSYGVQISLNIVENSEGGAYILWRDSRNPSVDLYAANLDGSGNNLWEANGMPIANSNNPETSNSMREDGDGGFFIGYQVKMNNNENIYAKRFNSDGDSVWGDPIPVAVANGDQSTIRVSPDGIGGYVFVWQDKREETTNIFAQRLLSDGTADWGDYTVVYSDEDNEQSFAQDYPQVQADGLGNTIIAWQDKRATFDNVGIYAQKINSSGQKVWDEDGVQIRAGFVREITLRIDSDTNGGAYIVWTDIRNSGVSGYDIYAQHILSDGTFAWGEDGVSICTAPNEQNAPLIKLADDHVFVVWLDARTGSLGIDHQIIDDTNNFVLTDNGETVFYGLSGDAGNYGQLEVYPRLNQNDAVVIWHDTRGADTGYQVYYQFINTDGSLDLEANGRPITIENGYSKSDFSASVNDAGETMVVWVEQHDGIDYVYAQLIDVDGNYLFGDEGMSLTTGYTNGQETPFVSYHNGDFYVGWTDNLMDDDYNVYKQVFGQRFSNGEPQWGQDGVQISGSESEYITEVILYDLVENYYIWNAYETERRVVKVNEDGEVVEGYSVEGNVIAPVGVAVNSGGSGLVHSGDLLYSWSDLRDDNQKTVYTQRFLDDGTFMWQDELPVSLPEVDGALNEASKPQVAKGDGIYIVWNESYTSDNENIKAQKLSFSGEHIFDEGGVTIAEGDITQNNPQIARISNDYYAIAWEQQNENELDLYMNLLRSNGEVFAENGIVLTDELKDQKTVKIAPMGDGKAIIVWADGISSGKTMILGVYGQYVDFSAVSNDDNNVQIANSQLLQNYPNPFNPTTNISFSLNKDEKDVELTIYNIKGQKVKTLVKDSFAKGNYSYVWEGNNDQNRPVASGVYFYKLTAGKHNETKKMILMK